MILYIYLIYVSIYLYIYYHIIIIYIYMYLLMTTGLHLKTYKDFSSFGDLGPTKGIQQVSIITWDNEFGENKHGNT